MPIIIGTMILVVVSACNDLSKESKILKMSYSTIDSSDPDYPLKASGDGYKMIKVIKDYDTEGEHLITRDVVEWGWVYKVENISDEREYVTVTYKLIDEDGFVISTDSESDYVRAGETVSIRSTSTFLIDDLSRVNNSTWNIRHVQK